METACSPSRRATKIDLVRLSMPFSQPAGRPVTAIAAALSRVPMRLQNLTPTRRRSVTDTDRLTAGDRYDEIRRWNALALQYGGSPIRP